MQGRFIILAMAASVLVPSAAFAAEVARRQACPKAEPQRAQTVQQLQQQRARTQECRTTRIVPPLVDPTPFFLL